MIQCDITLVALPPSGEWTNDQFANWLHPMHGPLPNWCCKADSGTDHYVVAVWFCQDRKGELTHCITLIECPQKPVGRGSILWSARWAFSSNKALVNNKKQMLVSKPLEKYKDAKDFLSDFLPHVIYDAETSPLGDVVSGRRQVVTNGKFVQEP